MLEMNGEFVDFAQSRRKAADRIKSRVRLEQDKLAIKLGAERESNLKFRSTWLSNVRQERIVKIEDHVDVNIRLKSAIRNDLSLLTQTETWLKKGYEMYLSDIERRNHFDRAYKSPQQLDIFSFVKKGSSGDCQSPTDNDFMDESIVGTFSSQLKDTFKSTTDSRFPAADAFREKALHRDSLTEWRYLASGGIEFETNDTQYFDDLRVESTNTEEIFGYTLKFPTKSPCVESSSMEVKDHAPTSTQSTEDVPATENDSSCDKLADFAFVVGANSDDLEKLAREYVMTPNLGDAGSVSAPSTPSSSNRRVSGTPQVMDTDRRKSNASQSSKAGVSGSVSDSYRRLLPPKLLFCSDKLDIEESILPMFCFPR